MTQRNAKKHRNKRLNYLQFDLCGVQRDARDVLVVVIGVGDALALHRALDALRQQLDALVVNLLGVLHCFMQPLAVAQS